MRRYGAGALRVVLARKAITQAELARRLGLRRQQVEAWGLDQAEGGHVPGADTLARIAEAVGCALDDLYGGVTG